MDREDKLVEIAEEMESISKMFKMFPDKVSEKVIKESAESLRDITDKLENLT